MFILIYRLDLQGCLPPSKEKVPYWGDYSKEKNFQFNRDFTLSSVATGSWNYTGHRLFEHLHVKTGTCIAMILND
jgi:hypothetical protein